MTTTSLKLEINILPKAYREEVADFVSFLQQKAKIKPSIKKREFGIAKGKIKLSEDFDAPLQDFKDYE